MTADAPPIARCPNCELPGMLRDDGWCYACWLEERERPEGEEPIYEYDEE